MYKAVHTFDNITAGRRGNAISAITRKAMITEFFWVITQRVMVVAW